MDITAQMRRIAPKCIPEGMTVAVDDLFIENGKRVTVSYNVHAVEIVQTAMELLEPQAIEAAVVRCLDSIAKSLKETSEAI